MHHNMGMPSTQKRAKKGDRFLSLLQRLMPKIKKVIRLLFTNVDANPKLKTAITLPKAITIFLESLLF